MSTPDETPLSPRQARFLAALMAAGTVTGAAAQAGLSYATARRWLKERPFLDALRQLRREALQAALAHLADGSGAAVRTLRDGLASPDARQRLRAAASYLKALKPLADLADLEEQLRDLAREVADLRRQQEERGGTPARYTFTNHRAETERPP